MQLTFKIIFVISKYQSANIWHGTTPRLAFDGSKARSHLMAAGRLLRFLVEASTLEQTAGSTKAPSSVGGAIGQGARRTFRIRADPPAIASSEDFSLTATSSWVTSTSARWWQAFSPHHFGSGHPDVQFLCDIYQLLPERLFPRRGNHIPAKERYKKWFLQIAR